MYNIENFEGGLHMYIGDKPVLAWSLKNGYHFLTFIERMHAVANGEVFKIVGVMK